MWWLGAYELDMEISNYLTNCLPLQNKSNKSVNYEEKCS